MRPSIGGGIHSIFEPAFRLACPQEIETGEQDHESQKPERKSGGNVVEPNSENERQEIRPGSRNQDEFPILLKNTEAP